MGMDEEAVGSGESFSAACTEEAQQRALRLAFRKKFKSWTQGITNPGY
jgi:hypothetical protein